MPYRNLSLEDFARYVGMDAREVHRLAQRGKLPGQKIGGEWRFNRARVTEWLQQEMLTLGENRLRVLEQTLASSFEGSKPSDSTVCELIGLEGIETVLPARTRAAVLRELVNLADRTGLLYDAQGLHEALCEREKLGSTGLPNGVAVPHARQPMPYATAEPLICVGRIAGGIGFGTPRGTLSHLFFLICCHEDRHHLSVLARLMRILDPPTTEALMAAETAEELLGLLLEREQVVVDSTL